jgi:hypothetical protein
MKNIHILSTDKPSRLVKLKMFGRDKLHLCKVIVPIQNEEKYQHIYITSDEEIKERDWVYCKTENRILLSNVSYTKLDDRFKIILTTDPNLIADGVQAIDDEFLEWFVKNPSCEFVKIDKWASLAECGYSYLITIPKEKLKQENCCTPVGQIKRYINCVGCDRKPEKETLEDVAKRLYTASPQKRKLFVEGAEWQSERMYSEDEVRLMLSESFKASQEGYNITADEIIQQFKKK